MFLKFIMQLRETFKLKEDFYLRLIHDFFPNFYHQFVPSSYKLIWLVYIWKSGGLILRGRLWLVAYMVVRVILPNLPDNLYPWYLTLERNICWLFLNIMICYVLVCFMVSPISNLGGWTNCGRNYGYGDVEWSGMLWRFI